MNKKNILATTLVIGFLMPYLSRIPLAFEKGIFWIWSYIPEAQAFVFFNTAFAGSLVPLALFGVLYVYEKLRLAFHLSIMAHFLTTIYLYNDYEARHAEDVINFILFPIVIAFSSLIGGGIGYVIERNICRSGLISTHEVK